MRRIGWIGSVWLLVGCSSAIDDPSAGQGGNGGSSTSSGGMSAGGAPAAGGSANGGASMGGAANGGAPAAGGTTGNGGSNNAGNANANGGSANGGKASGSGGKASGGSASGGTNTAGTTSAGTGGGGHTNPLTQEQIDAFVTAHNQARSGTLNPTPSPALPPVTWDATLADVAFNYLSKCTGTNLSDHNANRTKDYAALGGSDYVGENIYASSGKAAAPSAAVSSWMSEASSFDYNNPNLSAAGHYTQVVWRASVRIGCAIVTCPNLKYPNNILCDYAPGGNISGQKPY